MFFLSRVNVYNTCWRCVNTVKSGKRMVFRTLPVTNLIQTVPTKAFCTDLPLKSHRESVKMYLDYITDTYKSGRLQKDEDIGPFAKSATLQFMLHKRAEVVDNIRTLQEMVTDDKEMKALQMEEVLQYEKELDAVDVELLDVITSNLDMEVYKKVILEISPGVGGAEAMIFASDLLEMYIKYFECLGFQYEIIDYDRPQPNSIKHANVLITDDQAYSKLKYEGGVHRVQRIPQTERHGRIHTSTATVAILPEPSEIDIQILDKDIRIDTMRASGAGGQHVNSTDSAVRITHLPTGTMVTAQSQRSQTKNKEFAMLKLRTLLYEQQLSEQVSSTSTLRKQQTGRRTRNERIRTYNYPQDRITDHRSGEWKIGSLKQFMEDPSPLEKLQDLLQRDTQKMIFLEIVKKLKKRQTTHGVLH